MSSWNSKEHVPSSQWTFTVTPYECVILNEANYFCVSRRLLEVHHGLVPQAGSLSAHSPFHTMEDRNPIPNAAGLSSTVVLSWSLDAVGILSTNSLFCTSPLGHGLRCYMWTDRHRQEAAGSPEGWSEFCLQLSVSTEQKTMYLYTYCEFSPNEY